MSFAMIISPAKKMVADGSEPVATTRPLFLDEAHELALELRSLGPEEAQRIWRCSDALARENWDRVVTLPEDMLREPQALTSAASSYRGIQYTSLAPQIMDTVQLSWLERHLRIVSGMYGLLRPLDGVAPYRLEMQAKLPMGGARDLYEWWDSRIYDALVCEPGLRCIVNVASQEYAKAVLPHALEDGPTIVTCVFGTIGTDGKLRQPSTEAKAARGSFVRWAAEHYVERVGELRGFDERGYSFDEKRSNDGTWVFSKAKA